MRNLRLLDQYRIQLGGPVIYDTHVGAFQIPSPGTNGLRVIASAALDWDHVSVSLPNRCPNWTEMEKVKRLFFLDHETAMQLHVPPSDHINFHPYCLHLWRPHFAEIPRPPAEMVGPVKAKENAR
jgi:hypothetical protein